MNETKTSSTNTGKKIFEESKTINGQESKVTVYHYYQKPQSLINETATFYKGFSEGEYLEFVFLGKFSKLDHIQLEFEDDYTEIEILKNFENLENTTIVVETYLTEGIAFKKFKWTYLNGEEGSLLAAETDMN